MTTLTRKTATPPVLPEEVAPFPPAGGDVLVRGLLMTQRLANDRLHQADRVPLEDETDMQAHARAGARIVTRVLAQAVVEEGGQPLFTEEEWDRFGATHRADVFRIFNVAMRLSGHDLEVIEKN
jgi:hypothetical protein